jgi:hypothetical protein
VSDAPAVNPEDSLQAQIRQAQEERDRAAERERLWQERRRPYRELRPRWDQAWESVLLWTTEQNRIGRKPDCAGFQEWASLWIALGGVVNDYDRIEAEREKERREAARPAPAAQPPILLPLARLSRASSSGVQALDAAVLLLLVCCEGDRERAANLLEQLHGDPDLRRCFDWLLYVRDCLWTPDPNPLGFVHTADPPEGVSYDGFMRAEAAFGWKPTCAVLGGQAAAVPPAAERAPTAAEPPTPKEVSPVSNTRPLPVPDVPHEAYACSSALRAAAMAEKDRWHDRRDRASRALRTWLAGRPGRLEATAEALLGDVDCHWCEAWCGALGPGITHPSPCAAPEIRQWCDLQYAVLALTEHARRRHGWFQLQEPPPADVDFDPEHPAGRGRCLSLEEAAPLVACFLDGHEPDSRPEWEAAVARLQPLPPREPDEADEARAMGLMVVKLWHALRGIGDPPPEPQGVATIGAGRAALDSAKGWLGKQDAPPGDGRPLTAASSATPSGVKGKRIDERMLATIRDDSEAMYWSSNRWAGRLRCAASTVKESRTWKAVCMPARERERLARGKRLRGPRKRDSRPAVE